MNRRRREVASKSEIEFRLAKLDWYLQRLEEWTKLTHDSCGGPIAGGSSVWSDEQASSCCRRINLVSSVPLLRSVAAKAEKGGHAAVDKRQNRVVSGPGIRNRHEESVKDNASACSKMLQSFPAKAVV